MRTKWEIVVARRDLAQKALDSLNDQIRYMEKTPCKNSYDGEFIHCSTCNVEFKTEKDFADHYLVPDERYCNLGYCPRKEQR